MSGWLFFWMFMGGMILFAWIESWCDRPTKIVPIEELGYLDDYIKTHRYWGESEAANRRRERNGD